MCVFACECIRLNERLAKKSLNRRCLAVCQREREKERKRGEAELGEGRRMI